MALITRSMTVYQVGIHADEQLRIPQFCTCCLSPTSDSERLHFTTTKRNLVTRSKIHTSLNMPLCPECLKHRSEQTIKKYLALLLSILAGFIVFTAIRAQGTNLWLTLWLFATFALAVFFICDSYLPLSHLDKRHADRGASVAFAHVDDRLQLVVLNFANKEYAKRICAANSWTYHPALSQSEIRKYSLLIVACCLVIGLILQNIGLHFIK